MRKRFSDKLLQRIRMTASTTALWGVDKKSYELGLRDSSQLTLPDFLGLGAQKAGSTWLWTNLRCHPQLFLPEEKELHYFNLYFYTSLTRYASRFIEGKGRIKGEITPAYGILPPRKIAFIRKIMPDVRLILVLRNPIDRAWSRAKMVLREPGMDSIDFTRFSDREIHRAMAHPSSRARGDYLSIVDNWLRYFPAEQLHVCFYDDLVRQPRDFLAGIFGFLGVRRDVDWTVFPHGVVPNPTPRMKIPDKYREVLEAIYCPEIEALYQRFGPPVETWRCPQRALSRGTHGGEHAR